QVAANAVVEHRPLLPDISETGAPAVERDRIERAAVDQHAARGRGEQPGDEVDQGRLASARCPADADPVAAAKREADRGQAEIGGVAHASLFEPKLAPLERL